MTWYRCSDDTNDDVFHQGSDGLPRTCSACKPVVVIDPEDREQVERIYRRLHDLDDTYDEATPDELQTVFRALANPKPAEPTTIGSLVTDSDGETWVRDARGNWLCLHSGPGRDVRTWHDLNDRYGPVRAV